MYFLLALAGLALAGSLTFEKDEDESVETDTPDDGDEIRITDLSDIDPRLQGELHQGTDGDDVMDGGSGVDLMFGNEGNDIIRGGMDTDIIIDDEGADALFGGVGDDIIIGADLVDVDAIQAMRDDPPSSLDELATTLFSAFNTHLNDTDMEPDLLSGESGDDLLVGGNADTLVGGIGLDVFVGGEYVQPGAPVIVRDYDPDDDVIVYATEDGYADNLDVQLVGESGTEDALVLDSGVHVMTIKNAGSVFTVNQIHTLRDFL